MAEGYKPRVFTLQEANDLLPTLRAILHELREAREGLLAAQRELAQRSQGGPRSNGHVAPGGEVARLTAQAEEAQDRLTGSVRAIMELGCELKDPERGMIDFRTERDGRIVYFCWLMDEPRITYWHELEAGFRGRQPLEN